MLRFSRLDLLGVIATVLVAAQVDAAEPPAVPDSIGHQAGQG